MEGIKRIQLREGYEVYTNTVGRGKTPILLLHGGPGGSSECFEIMEKHIDLEKYQLIYYDQLGSYRSDEITDKSLLTLERYVDEVEQVRAGLGLNNFILLGHSWGGMLCIEYALKYQKQGHLKGLVISNMTASNDAYEASIDKCRKRILSAEEFDYLKEIESRSDFSDSRYKEIVYGKLYPACIFRLDETPAFFDENKMARIVYETFQGDNEFVVTGTLKDWDRWSDLKDIYVDTLVIGAVHDTMSVEDKKKMTALLGNGQVHICPEGSHFAFWDDVAHYYSGLERFMESLS